MNYRVLGWPPDGPRLALDYRAFVYAGKFHTPKTGVTVVTDSSARPTSALDLDGPEPAPPPAGTAWTTTEEPVVAAVACNADRTDETVVWLRYVTVRVDRRGAGLGGRLAAFTAERAATEGYQTARIAVNNAFSYRALSKAGFEFTGRETGLAELVLERSIETAVHPTETAAHPTETATRPDPDSYRDGLERLRNRAETSDAEAAALERWLADGDPPPLVSRPWA